MRTREQIIKNFDEVSFQEENEIVIEVLLDIRDLLKEIKERS